MSWLKRSTKDTFVCAGCGSDTSVFGRRQARSKEVGRVEVCVPCSRKAAPVDHPVVLQAIFKTPDGLYLFIDCLATVCPDPQKATAIGH